MRILISTPTGPLCLLRGGHPRLTGVPDGRGLLLCRLRREAAPASCTYEADLAEDGVDRLGLPFAARVRVSRPAREQLVTGGATKA